VPIPQWLTVAAPGLGVALVDIKMSVNHHGKIEIQIGIERVSGIAGITAVMTETGGEIEVVIEIVGGTIAVGIEIVTIQKTEDGQDQGLHLVQNDRGEMTSTTIDGEGKDDGRARGQWMMRGETNEGG